LAMEKTFAVINEILSAGVIDSYALGGAMAAIRYIEPFQTEDVDVFVSVAVETSKLEPLKPIYDHLKARGYFPKDVYIEIEGWDVQFLPVFDELTDEAVVAADDVELNGEVIKVMKPEYLVAIMLKTGRLKDFARVKMFFDQRKVDEAKLNVLIDRFSLKEKWQKFQKSQ
jgi:hypothetical protein